MKGKAMWIVAMFVVPVAANDNDNVEVLQLSANEKKGLSLYTTPGLLEVGMEAEDDQLRTWFVCQVNKTGPRSAAERDAGIVTVNAARCTPQMNFGVELCCNRYEAEDFSHVAKIVFPTEQDEPVDGGGDNLSYRVCSEAVNGEALTAHEVAAVLPIECDPTQISQDELNGNDEYQPGEIVLRTRLLYFKGMQIPPSAVPRCEDVPAACGDGRSKTVVNPVWVSNLSEGAPGSLRRGAYDPTRTYSWEEHKLLVAQFWEEHAQGFGIDFDLSEIFSRMEKSRARSREIAKCKEMLGQRYPPSRDGILTDGGGATASSLAPGIPESIIVTWRRDCEVTLGQRADCSLASPWSSCMEWSVKAAKIAAATADKEKDTAAAATADKEKGTAKHDEAGWQKTPADKPPKS